TVLAAAAVAVAAVAAGNSFSENGERLYLTPGPSTTSTTAYWVQIPAGRSRPRRARRLLTQNDYPSPGRGREQAVFVKLDF
ncbi:MAG: hypothetical protein MK312_03240, partial [Roseibacillus sp.]|nr:hypothetical protein [Roseibacillus sp.]